MATLVKKHLDGKIRWQAVIRSKGVKTKKTFDLKAQAEAWAREVEREGGWSQALGAPGAKLTFAQLAKKYLDAGLGRESRVKFWIDAIGTKTLPTITARDVQQALDDYSAGTSEVYVGGGKTRPRKSGTTRGPASRNRLRSTAASIFRWARGQQIFSGNPVKDVLAVPEPKGRDRFLTEEEAEKLLNAARQPLIKSEWKKLPLLVSMALATGARASELTEKIRWERINWRERTVPIDDTKNGDPRVLVLPVPVVEELMKHRPVDKDGKVIDKPTGLVFGRPDDPEQPFTVRKHWLAAVKAAGISNFRFHDCRHTAASWLVSSGADLYTTGKVLGHRSPQSTARYAHLSIAAKKRAVELVMGARLRIPDAK
jgi:integrase